MCHTTACLLPLIPERTTKSGTLNWQSPMTSTLTLQSGSGHLTVLKAVDAGGGRPTISFGSVGTVTVLQAASTPPIVAAANNAMIRIDRSLIVMSSEPFAGRHSTAQMHLFRFQDGLNKSGSPLFGGRIARCQRELPRIRQRCSAGELSGNPLHCARSMQLGGYYRRDRRCRPYADVMRLRSRLCPTK